MQTILLVILILIALALIGVVLVQRSEGGALGIGGGGFGGLMSGRQSANLLTRTTAVLAACFIATSMLLALMASRGTGPRSILDQPAATPSAPAAPTAPAAPAKPSEPSAPVAK